jgi:hypothetical protein
MTEKGIMSFFLFPILTLERSSTYIDLRNQKVDVGKVP